MTKIVMPTIKNWYLTYDVAHFISPEYCGCRVCGRVYNSDRFEDGKEVITSTVVAVENNVVITKHGSFYRLSEVNADYQQWCEQNGHYVPTEESPIQVSNKTTTDI